MISTSEYVAAGHPDKIADCIVSEILDRYLAIDKKARVALECQVKDNYVTLGGEITSTVDFSTVDLTNFVKEAVRKIGYTDDYADYWGEGNCIDPRKIEVACHISQQSPDIAQGVNADGWGDQGIMWGMAVEDERTNHTPADIYLAREIGKTLYGIAKDRKINIGLDIKTQVEIRNGKVTKVIAAVPMKDESLINCVESIIDGVLLRHSTHIPISGNVKKTINGTGVYVRHSSQGDCGTTGRKLAVDFYGGNCRIGGGCPWGKDPSKADVALNVYARHLATKYMHDFSLPVVYCAISCCIGKKDIKVALFNSQNELIAEIESYKPAPEIIESLGLYEPCYFKRCVNGLFSL